MQVAAAICVQGRRCGCENVCMCIHTTDTRHGRSATAQFWLAPVYSVTWAVWHAVHLERPGVANGLFGGRLIWCRSIQHACMRGAGLLPQVM
jgi:hypothetical protein